MAEERAGCHQVEITVAGEGTAGKFPAAAAAGESSEGVIPSWHREKSRNPRQKVSE